jgi:hypothetical protein
MEGYHRDAIYLYPELDLDSLDVGNIQEDSTPESSLEESSMDLESFDEEDCPNPRTVRITYISQAVTNYIRKSSERKFWTQIDLPVPLRSGVKKPNSRGKFAYCRKCEVPITKDNIIRHFGSLKHLRIESRRLICLKCGHTSPDNDDYVEHRKTHGHKQLDTYTYYYHQCLSCDTFLRCKSTVDVHIKSRKHLKNLSKSKFKAANCVIKRTVCLEKKK